MFCFCRSPKCHDYPCAYDGSADPSAYDGSADPSAYDGSADRSAYDRPRSRTAAPQGGVQIGRRNLHKRSTDLIFCSVYGSGSAVEIRSKKT